MPYKYYHKSRLISKGKFNSLWNLPNLRADLKRKSVIEHKKPSKAKLIEEYYKEEKRRKISERARERQAVRERAEIRRALRGEAARRWDEYEARRKLLRLPFIPAGHELDISADRRDRIDAYIRGRLQDSGLVPPEDEIRVGPILMKDTQSVDFLLISGKTTVRKHAHGRKLKKKKLINSTVIGITVHWHFKYTSTMKGKIVHKLDPYKKHKTTHNSLKVNIRLGKEDTNERIAEKIMQIGQKYYKKGFQSFHATLTLKSPQGKTFTKTVKRKQEIPVEFRHI